jgi:hypothetical protein
LRPRDVECDPEEFKGTLGFDVDELGCPVISVDSKGGGRGGGGKVEDCRAELRHGEREVEAEAEGGDDVRLVLQAGERASEGL